MMTAKISKAAKVKTQTVEKPRRNGSRPTLRWKSISEVVHDTAKGFYAAGLMDQATMREFDALRLPKVPSYTPRQIKAIRNRCKASQPVFAAYMNITASSLQKWESGARKPDNVAMKLLNL